MQFDRAYDAVEGGTISCGVGTSPSQLNLALERMSRAAAADDRAALAQMLAPELTFIDREGNRTSFPDGSRIEDDLDAIFAPDVLSVLAKADLSRVTVVPDQVRSWRLAASGWRPARPAASRKSAPSTGRHWSRRKARRANNRPLLKAAPRSPVAFAINLRFNLPRLTHGSTPRAARTRGAVQT